jgi:flavin-dependent dehydrogenase
VSSQETYGPEIDVNNLGYAWRFPLSEGEYHIGAGSVTIAPRQMLENLGWLKKERKVVDKAIQGEPLGLFDGLILRKSTQRFGINIGYRQGSALLKSLTGTG